MPEMLYPSYPCKLWMRDQPSCQPYALLRLRILFPLLATDTLSSLRVSIGRLELAIFGTCFLSQVYLPLGFFLHLRLPTGFLSFPYLHLLAIYADNSSTLQFILQRWMPFVNSFPGLSNSKILSSQINKTRPLKAMWHYSIYYVMAYFCKLSFSASKFIPCSIWSAKSSR